MAEGCSESEWRRNAAEKELAEWQTTNRFCGKCGAAMSPHANPAERAMVCPECGYTAYPAIAPSVIVLVTNGDKILLQRNTHYSGVKWSLAAGFVEPGETLEDAIRREAKEESGIDLKDIRYASSQAWPFPSTIMVGFRAEYAGGELHPDGDEVVEAGWFSREALPLDIPKRHSIARRLINEWIKESFGFYGSEHSPLQPVNGDYAFVASLGNLYRRLMKCWKRETCAPRLQEKWSEANLTCGQCSITAFLAQDIFGGEVYGVPNGDGSFHCFNKVGDCIFDLTSEQFDHPLAYTLDYPQCRDVHFAKAEKRARYKVLKAVLLQTCKVG